jgi:UDP-N-acetylmuramyl pentapeptide phosphotransferase/UDP-N-acetylglucosamine-1-phosphate transferase
MVYLADIWSRLSGMTPADARPALAALLLVAVAAGLTALVIVLLRPLLLRVALAKPNARSSHTEPTPQGGGLAVVATIVALAGLATLATNMFPAETLDGLVPVLCATLVLAAVGALDDVRSLGMLPRLLAQLVAVAMVLAALPQDARALPELPLFAERVLLLAGGVAFVNIVNFMDGIDWMVVAEVVPLCLGIVLIAVLDDLPSGAVFIALVLLGSMLGFAYFNRPVAQLFLGDVGSLAIGLLLAWLLFQVAAAGHLAAALLLPLFFVADTLFTLVRRTVAGERFWEAHRTHCYQRATDNGFATLQIVSCVFAVNLCLVGLAVATVIYPSHVVSLVALAAGLALVAGLMAAFVRGRP